MPELTPTPSPVSGAPKSPIESGDDSLWSALKTRVTSVPAGSAARTAACIRFVWFSNRPIDSTDTMTAHRVPSPIAMRRAHRRRAASRPPGPRRAGTCPARRPSRSPARRAPGPRGGAASLRRHHLGHGEGHRLVLEALVDIELVGEVRLIHDHPLLRAGAGLDLRQQRRVDEARLPG